MKKVLVIATGEIEALRMAIGITVLDDRITVVFNGLPEFDDENAQEGAMYIDTLRQLGCDLYCTEPGHDIHVIDPAAFAELIINSDHVIRY